MLKKSFKGKLILPVVILLFLLVSTLTVTTSLEFSRYNNDLIVEQLELNSEAMKDDLESMKTNSLAAAKMMAKDPDIVEAVKAGDTAKIIEVLTPTIELFSISYYTVSDGDGIVLARTHNPSKLGDSVTGQRNIKDALGGKTSTYFEAGTEVKVSVRTGAPVYDTDGTLVGVVSAGVQFDTDDFVDKLKRTYNVEATVFSGDTRIATTIMKDGERVVGTQLDPEITKIVLDGKQEYFGEVPILGNKYKAFYLPLLNADNEAFAIVFLGRSTAEIASQTNSFIIMNVLIGGLILAISIAILIFVTSKISKPITKLAGVLNDMADGNLSNNIDVKSEDEIGMLGKDLQKVTDTLRKLLDDIKRLAGDFAAGETDVKIDADSYHGEYRDIAIAINETVGSAINDVLYSVDLVTEFGNGNFDVSIRELLGKKIVLTESFRTVQANLINVSNEISNAVEGAINGNLDISIDTDKFQGDWKKMSESINALLAAVVKPVREAISVLNQLSEGSLDASVSGDYKGEFAAMKSALNNTLSMIASYIKEISVTLNELANNNLVQEITGEYVGDFVNIKNSLNNIIEKLNTVMIEINAASEQVAAGSKQMSESSMVLAQGATMQASSVQQLTATVTSVNEKTRLTAANAKRAEDLSRQSNENASIGNEEMMQMLQSMEAIRESSNNISNIIKVIEDIAFQTNLLALNAAVEAARAGEHGKGFAVVAEEVRNLAGRSQTAARETTALIENSIQKVNEGVKIATGTANALEKIVSNVTEVSSIISEISDASNEQAQAISQINDGVSQIADVVQSNSATSEESAAASQELSSQSELLKTMIRAFKLKKQA